MPDFSPQIDQDGYLLLHPDGTAIAAQEGDPCCCGDQDGCCEFAHLARNCIFIEPNDYVCCELGQHYQLSLYATAQRTMEVTRPFKPYSNADEVLPTYTESSFTASFVLDVRCVGGQRFYTATGSYRGRRRGTITPPNCAPGQPPPTNLDLPVERGGLDVVDRVFGRAIGLASPGSIVELLSSQTDLGWFADDTPRGHDACRGNREFSNVLNQAGTLTDRGSHSWDYANQCLQRSGEYLFGRTIRGVACASETGEPIDSAFVSGFGSFLMQITRINRCAQDPCAAGLVAPRFEPLAAGQARTPFVVSRGCSECGEEGGL